MRSSPSMIGSTFALAALVCTGVGCAQSGAPAAPSLPAARALATVPSSDPSIASWKLYSSGSGLGIFGVAKDGTVAAQTHLVAIKNDYSAMRSLYPERAELVTDAKGKVLTNTLRDAPAARALMTTMQSDISVAEKSGVPYGCAGDSITAFGTCLAAAGCAVADIETADLVCIGTFIGCGGSVVALCEDCGICNYQPRNSQCDDYNYSEAHCVECYGQDQCYGTN